MRTFSINVYKGSVEEFWVDMTEYLRQTRKRERTVYLYSSRASGFLMFSYSTLGPKTMELLGVDLLESRDMSEQKLRVVK